MSSDMPNSSMVRSKDGIDWYVERQGSGPDLVLIPSGEGDCESFAKVAAILSSSFYVTTFDMPGMSRTVAPSAAVENVTWDMLASQVMGLMDALEIQEATFYGCSSGGATVLCLVRDYATRVRSGIVHEVPLHALDSLKKLCELDDASIVKVCQDIFSNHLVADKAAWEALGSSFFSRLERNYVTWIRGYIPGFQNLKLSKEELTRKPVTWSVGGLSKMGDFVDNVVVATSAGIEVGVLPCKHFPQVSIPEVFAEHLRAAALRYL